MQVLCQAFSERKRQFLFCFYTSSINVKISTMSESLSEPIKRRMRETRRMSSAEKSFEKSPPKIPFTPRSCSAGSYEILSLFCGCPITSRFVLQNSPSFLTYSPMPLPKIDGSRLFLSAFSLRSRRSSRFLLYRVPP